MFASTIRQPCRKLTNGIKWNRQTDNLNIQKADMQKHRDKVFTLLTITDTLSQNLSYILLSLTRLSTEKQEAQLPPRRTRDADVGAHSLSP